MRRDPAVEQRSWKHMVDKTRAAAIARFILNCDDAATRLLHRATIFRKPIMLTLKRPPEKSPLKWFGKDGIIAKILA
jgi:hypothetical protein